MLCFLSISLGVVGPELKTERPTYSVVCVVTQCDAVWRCVMQCDAVWCNTTLYHSVCHSVPPCDAVWHNFTECNAVWRNVTQCNAVWCLIANVISEKESCLSRPQLEMRWCSQRKSIMEKKILKSSEKKVEQESKILFFFFEGPLF